LLKTDRISSFGSMQRVLKASKNPTPEVECIEGPIVSPTITR
jgi:hypothetical protein